MQVLDTSGLITNYEVYQLLSEKHALDNASKKLRRLPMIEAQVLGYIATTPAATLKQPGVSQFLAQVPKYGLTKAEVLQILNHCPTSEVELHLIVEQCEERLSPEQRAELLADIYSSLSQPVEESNGAQTGATTTTQEEDAEAAEDEAAMELEGMEDQPQEEEAAGEGEEEENELLHEEAGQAGEAEEDTAADGDDDDAKGGEDNN